MFQDYCVAHGKPCVSGSLYCSDECRDQDIQDCSRNNSIVLSFLQLPLGLPVNHPRETMASSEATPDLFMYECCYCNETHNPEDACNEAGASHYTYGTFQYDADSVFSSPQLQPQAEPLHYSVGANDDLIRHSHQLIQENYRKWLVNVSPY